MVHRDKIYDCNNCKASFEYKDLEIRCSDYGGVMIQTKVCPRCRSESWSDNEDRKKLEKFLLLNM